MPHYDFRTPRIYLDVPLAAGQAVSFDRAQANYLLNVLRLKHGDALLLFNGRDGEWQARLAGTGKRALTAVIGERMREQPRPSDLHFLFAPLKHARLDYLVQKAVEMGAARLQPVITRHAPVGALPAAARAGRPLAVLIGPEGGFAEEERDSLLKRPNVVRIALGPRILRADTAAVAALALVQAVLGDWRSS